MSMKKVIKWTGFNVSEVEKAFFGNVHFSIIAVYTNVPVTHTAHVYTKHGQVIPNIGDYIIEDENGDIFVLNPMQYMELDRSKAEM